MKRKKRRKNNIRYSKLVIITSLFLFALMIARVTQLALAEEIDDTNLQALAKKRTTKTDIIKAERGNIYSSDGEALAQNVSSYKLIAYLSPSRTTDEDNPQHVVDKEMTAEKLAGVLGVSKEEILKYLNKEGIYQTEFGTIGKGLTEITKEKIEELNLPGIDFVESFKRYYPKGDFASYVLGYAKEEVTTNEDGSEETTMTGEMGIEKYYDSTLKGEDGYTTYQKDLRGYKIAGTNEISKEASDGKDIYLTLNSSIQFFVEQALSEADTNYDFEWFTIMIADAKTGAILASSSYPSFDPNERNITNYLDLNVSSPYEPGSTMKIFTYMAAMEQGVYDGNEIYHSGTYVTTDGTEIGDWKREGWGDITFDKGFALSSNVGVINLIDRHLSADILRSYFKKLGFSKKTGIELPNESEGDIDFKYETEIFNAGFGQGITTTPIQNIQALTSLTNEGVMLKPYLVEKIVDPDTEEVVYEGKRTEVDTVASVTTVNKIKDLMWETVNTPGMTGAGYKLEGYDLIGKTGTAQIADENGGGYLTGASDIISSFAGVYPKDDPKVIIYASVKRPEGGNQKIIQEAIKDIVVNISKYYGTDPDTTSEVELKEYSLTSYKNKEVTDSKAELESMGMSVTVIGNGNKVIKQYPSKGDKVTEGTKVFLITNDSNLTVPDVNGLSSKQAEDLLKMLGISVKLEGNGYVTGQSIGVGTPITDNMEIILTLSPKF
ncbi:MAG TPA: penicillin-binding protein [Candidatus Onthousia faecipullorum]|uniref:Penicillin-binding protein n=1 Tax=Candidatus Onthousia faecipullorum TaxID=2840887 RepID=A0A9D1GCB1_9FIRM|nr:penicillin-binding protein [Candidatus Onthousia faecipullorum]